MTRDILENFFAEHLHVVEEDCAAGAEVAHVATHATRYVLFKIGQIRFALASTAIASLGREREAGAADAGRAGEPAQQADEVPRCLGRL